MRLEIKLLLVAGLALIALGLLLGCTTSDRLWPNPEMCQDLKKDCR